VDLNPVTTESAESVAARRARHWQRTLRLTAILMSVWLLASFVMVFFARTLAQWTFFGWPVPFFMAAQGSLFVFLAIIYIYARRMARLDRMYRADEDAAAGR